MNFQRISGIFQTLWLELNSYGLSGSFQSRRPRLAGLPAALTYPKRPLASFRWWHSCWCECCWPSHRQGSQGTCAGNVRPGVFFKVVRWHIIISDFCQWAPKEFSRRCVSSGGAYPIHPDVKHTSTSWNAGVNEAMRPYTLRLESCLGRTGLENETTNHTDT